ncbi:hypothetical protein [Streptosporangium longisporum]|uniref:Uncharacterized protein n=1 Tax=Streptosporangium longisporum TaxID=46187 RepID=A0ABN3XS82_9ACTN
MGARALHAHAYSGQGQVGETSQEGSERSAERGSQREHEGPRGGGVAARFAGTCVGCGQGYPVQTLIEKVEQGWAHPACAEAIRARAQILAGETYRGHKEPDWRRGSSPSSMRTAR